jgi:hypothetical protein
LATISTSHLPRAERRDLQEGRTGIEELFDAFPCRQLALVAMSLEVFLAAAEPDSSNPIPQLRNELRHSRVVVAVERSVLLDVGGQDVHEADPRRRVGPAC